MRTIRLAWTIGAAMVVAGALAATPERANLAVPGVVIVEPPTLQSLGLEWTLSGDANRNATRISAAIALRNASATGQEQHGVLVDYGDFVRLSAPDPKDPRRFYRPDEFDFTLKAGSRAIDAGVVLPNANDGYSGRAPDLGAYERGRRMPVYGPRKVMP
jgi:hypothetical protein